MFGVYKKSIKYVPEKKHYLAATIILSIGGAILQIFAYYYLFEFLQNVIINEKMNIASIYAFRVASLLASGGVLYILSLTLSHLFAFRLETNLRKYGIEGLTKASFKFFDVNSSGKTRKLIDDNAAQTHMAVAHLIPDNTGAICMPILLITLGLVISIRIGIILIILIVLSFVLMRLMMGEQRFMKTYEESLEKLSAETVEYVRGMQVIKIFGIDVRSFRALNVAIKQYAKYALDYSMSCRRPYVIFQEIFFGLVAIIIPIVIAFVDIAHNPKMLATELIMLVFLGAILFTYIMKVMYLSMYVFQAQDAVSKLEDIYDEMRKDRLDFGEEVTFANHDIEFDHVSFGYGDGNQILENLSFKLLEGRTYALVGESGSGKSTIAKLISGFYNVNSGQVKIGDKNITDYSEKAIISEVAFVFQDAKLFKMSIYDNVALANRSAERDEVMKALHLAECDDIINKFKYKENTLIGSNGVYLSGGEKQRIAIARAILKDAKIIIFDEASASIDADNEHELQKAFANLMKDKTIIMIAHRLTTIRNVDEILVLREGKIIERGTDSQLMNADTVYKNFQNMYKMANEWRVSNERVI